MTIDAAQYGPWAVITGASDGTGAAFAHQLAQAGIHLVLVARREGPLQSLAAELEAEYGIETRTASIDLYNDDGAAAVIAAAAGLEVGFFVANAGSDTNGSQFLDKSIQPWEDLMLRNVLNVVRCTHYFAGPMRDRRRGGIVILSSGSALAGQPGGAVYSGSKSFQVNFSEALWCELRHHNVHVLCGVCAAMDTPTIRQLLADNDLPAPPLLDPTDVVASFLEVLGQKPIHISPFMGNDEQMAMVEAGRLQGVLAMEESTKRFYKAND